MEFNFLWKNTPLTDLKEGKRSTFVDFSKFLKFWFPVIVYSGIIFYVSSWPNLQVPVPGNNVDKLFHVLEFIPFGYLLTRALTQGTLPLKKSLFLWVAVLSFLYALSDEFHQLFVLGRSWDFIDALADTIGGCLGALILNWQLQKQKIYRRKT